MAMTQAFQSSEPPKEKEQIKIGRYLVKPQHNQLICDDEVIDLEPLAMSMLLLLAEEPGRVVSAEELFEKLWQGKVVSDGALHRIVRQLRKALKDNAAEPEYIRTVRKGGYALISPVETPQSTQQSTFPNPVKMIILASFVILTAIVFWFGATTKPTYQLQDTQLLTSLPGVERDPVIWQQQNAVIFTYQPPGELYNNIMMRPLDKSSYRNLTNDHLHYTNLSLSNDGKYLAFLKRGVRDCVIQYANLTSPRFKPQTLTECRFEAMNLLVWSKDNSKLYFEHTSEQAPNSQIMMVDIASRQVEPLTNPSNEYSDYHQAISSQGNLIAFIRAGKGTTRIQLLNLTNMQQRTLYQWPKEFVVTGMYWLPQQKTLLLNTRNELKILTLNGELYPVNNSDKVKKETLAIDAQGRLILAATDYYSQLVEYDLPQPGQAAIKEHQTGEPWLVSSKSEYDGQYGASIEDVVFLSSRESKQYRLWVHQYGKSSLLYDKPIAGSPRWSNDFKYVMFLTQNHRIGMIDLASKAVSFPLPDMTGISRIAWSFDDRLIYFSKPLAGKHQLMSLNINSGELQQLTEDGGYHPHPSDDGRYLYYNKYDQKGLWRLDLASNTHEPLIEDFHQMNYASWQAFDNGVYYVRDADAVRGLFFYDFATQSQRQLIDNKEFFRFNVSENQKTVLITEKKALIGDLHITRLVEE